MQRQAAMKEITEEVIEGKAEAETFAALCGAPSIKSDMQTGDCVDDTLQEQDIDCKAEAETFDAPSGAESLDYMGGGHATAGGGVQQSDHEGSHRGQG